MPLIFYQILLWGGILSNYFFICALYIEINRITQRISITFFDIRLDFFHIWKHHINKAYGSVVAFSCRHCDVITYSKPQVIVIFIWHWWLRWFSAPSADSGVSLTPTKYGREISSRQAGGYGNSAAHTFSHYPPVRPMFCYGCSFCRHSELR